MSNARNLAKVAVDANGDIGTASLDNVPPSNDASALTTGTLPVDRLSDFGVPVTKLGAGAILQIQYSTYWVPAEQTIAYGSYYDFPTVTITPKSNNSTLILIGNPLFYSRTADRGTYGNTYVYAQNITTSTEVKLNEWLNYADNVYVTDGLRLRYPFMYPFANSSLSQQQLRLRAYNNSSTSTGRIGGENLHMSLVIEVKN